MGLVSRSENCCCCIGVKAGTLILLYLDLFLVIIAMIKVFNGAQTGGYTSVSMDGDFHPKSAIDLGSPFVIGIVLLLIIIVAGLFAIGKKKPTLLIPYFIIRIVISIAVILVLAPLLFLEKKGLDFLQTPKSYNRVYSDMSGDNDNGLGKTLDYASNGLYALIGVEIILIILQIHYAKVVYACYKKIGEELDGNQGIIYASQFPPCVPPYVPLQQQSISLVPTQEPVHIC